MSTSSPIESTLDAILGATRILHSGLGGDASLDALAEARRDREDAYRRLVASVDRETWQADGRARALLEEIAALDQDLLALGEKLPSAFRARAHALHRRRSAVLAHAARERGEPRVVTVKA